MKAAICKKYGGPEVLQLGDVAKPSPKDGEVLVRIHAASVSAGDYRIRGLNVPFGYKTLLRLVMGWNGPRAGVLGADCAGAVEAVGPGVTRFQPGDKVMALTGPKMGGYGEYICLPESRSLAPAPAGLDLTETAALPFGGSTALSFLLDKAALKPGERVLVNGASGAVGVMEVQVAKAHGAHVTAICSGKNADLMRDLGADAVIDYTREDFRSSGARWHVICDNVGNISFRDARRHLAPGGRFLMIVANMGKTLLAPLASLSGLKTIAGISSENGTLLTKLAHMVEAGQVRAVVDRVYPLDEIVEAHRYAEQGHKVGNVIVTMA